MQSILQNAEEKFRLVADFTYDWEYWLGIDNELLYVSPSCERITGYTLDEFMASAGLIENICHPEDREKFIQHWQKECKLTENVVGELDYRIVRRDGQTRWIGHVCQAVYGENDHLLGRRVSNRDITERKQTEIKLRHAEATLRAMLESTWHSYTLIDRDYRIIDADEKGKRASEDIFGKRMQPGDSIYDFVLDRDKESFTNNFDRALRGEAVTIEKWFQGRQGAEYYYEVRYYPVTDDLGETIGVCMSHEDVTERKWTEEVLRESEERFRKSFDTELVAMAISRQRDGMYLDVNPGFVKMTGYSRDELIGHTSQELKFFSPLQRRTLLADMEERGRLHDQELTFTTKQGKLRTILFSIGPITIGSEACLLATIVDITDRKHTEEALARRNRLLRTLHEVTLDISTELELPALLNRLLDYARILLNAHEGGGIALYRPETGLLHIAASQDNQLPIDKALDPEEGIVGWVFRHNESCIVEDYSRWEHRSATFHNPNLKAVLGVPLRWQGEIIGVMSLGADQHRISFDADDLHLAEMFAAQAAIAIENARFYQKLEQLVEARTTELQESTERVKAILNYSPDAILLLNYSFQIEIVNPATSTLFGYRPDELYGKSLALLVMEDDRERLEQAAGAVMQNVQTQRLEIQVKHKNGDAFHADVAIAPVEQGSGTTGLVCGLRDISVLKEVERMKDAFVSNVSHELRTPISSIKLYHELLMKNPIKQDIYMQRLQRETARLHHIVESVLLLSRLDQEQITLKFALTDLNTLAAEYVADRNPLAEQKGLSLFTEEVALPPVQADSDLLGQALSILLTNAINYTPAGGQVTVSTITRWAEGKRWAGLAVRDTGPGIPLEEQSHLFRRFFRGSVGHRSNIPGTGLGLAIVKEIVQRHTGIVEAQSVPGEGTTFRIWLPVVWNKAPI